MSLATLSCRPPSIAKSRAMSDKSEHTIDDHPETRAERVAAKGTDERPLTRREAAQFLTSHGFRISYATLAKLCSPAISEGPVSCGRWGRDSLYVPSDLLAWAQNRLQSPRAVG
jgi:hypothetical protein